MDKMENKCAVCKQKASSKCSKCCVVFYCSKDHQKDDWKTHKNNCKPVLIKEDKILGRHLVASKDIKEGEIIFKEKPLVIGPAQMTAPVCLGCYKIVTETTSKPCSKCGWPVCDENCEKSPNHKAECEMTVQRGQKVNIKTFGCVHPSYQCITVMRCLHLKKSNPEVWKLLTKFESHCDQRKGTYKWENDKVQIAQFSRNFFKIEEQFSEDDIMKMCGIVQVNGHEVPFTEPPFVAIYNITSMLEHNCKANCSKSFTGRGEVLIAAATDIKAGQNLSICYTDPLWGTINRRHHLEETKFFKCFCDRCKDVTEMGTMFSALKCQNQGCSGYALPKTFLFDDENKSEDQSRDWFCNKCDKVISEASAQKLVDHVGRDLNAMEKGDSHSCKRFLEHYGKYLHPSHYYLMDVTLALAQLIGQDTIGGLAEVTDENLALKTNLCRKVVEFLDKLVLAEVRGRGTVLFELHAAIAETGRRRAATTGEGPSVLIDYLLDSKKMLEKSLKLLQHEPIELPEGKIAAQGGKNLEDMEKLLKSLYAAVDSSPM